MGKEIIKIIKYLFSCVLQVIYPDDNKCVVCGNEIEDCEILCSKCMNKIKFYDKLYELSRDKLVFRCFSSCYYSGIIKELVVRLKYKSDFKCGKALAGFMINTINNNKIKSDYITFVPSTKEVKHKRGYNQSEYLAKEIGMVENIQVHKVLRKNKNTRDQIGLNGEKRWENLLGVFEVSDRSLVIDKNILLIDDVITTGATAFYCSEKLIKAGASSVTIISAAKSIG